MLLQEPILIGKLTVENRLVMPPMQTGRTAEGQVTEDLVEYYRSRAALNDFGLIVTEHSCVSEAGRANAEQLSLADDGAIAGHRRIVDAIHEAGSRTFAQLNHAGSAARPLVKGQNVSASAVNIPARALSGRPRALTEEEIKEIERQFAAAAVRALAAGYDGVEIHCAHGYLLNQFYSPLTNRREDAYGPQSVENRTRFLIGTVGAVRAAIGDGVPLAVRLGGADYLPKGSTEEDAAEACRLLEAAGVDLLDISGGMCFFMRPGHTEPGYFGSMTEKIKAAVKTPVLLTGGVKTVAEAEALLASGKADLIGVGRAVFHNAAWRRESE